MRDSNGTFHWKDLKNISLGKTNTGTLKKELAEYEMLMPSHGYLCVTEHLVMVLFKFSTPQLSGALARV